MTIRALDLFAGHGWGVACQRLGIEEYGVEIMPEAVAVRERNGMRTLYRDVWDGLISKRVYVNGNQERAARRPENRPAPTIHFGRALNDVKWQVEPINEWDWYDLLIASPPCQAFSMAGKGAGRKALDDVLEAIDERLYLDPERLRTFADHHGDDRIALVLTPLAHVARDTPTYVVFEQVPPVLPVWERCAEEMRRWGYSVWTGYLQAEMYGTVVTCPMHESTASGAARALRASPADLVTAASAGTGLSEWLESASIAEDRETFVRARASVEHARRGTLGTTDDEERVRAAWTAALISRAVLEDAPDATWLALVKPLLSLALAATRTLPGRAGGMSMSAATFGFESMEYIGESIESLPSRLWDALCALAKSYITSTRRPTTTIPETSPSSAATPIIADTIESVTGRALCGVCNDHAVPQTRKRAILIARADGKEARPPAPTHSRYYSRDPQRLDPGVKSWVSMAEALGWGMTERPFVTAGNAVGRAEGNTHVWPDGGRPSPTVTGGGAATGGAEVFGRHGREIIRKMHLDPDKPATPAAGDPRLTSRDHHGPGDQAARATRVTVAEAAALQSYPPDFIWDAEFTDPKTGRTKAVTKTNKFLQIGNAAPPLLAEAILREVLS